MADREMFLARAQRVLGLRLAYHDNMRAYWSGQFSAHNDRACLSVRKDHQPECAAFCGGKVHERLAHTHEPCIHTCPFGHTEIVAPLLNDGLFMGVLFAGPCWTEKAKPPREGLVRPTDKDWLPDRLALFRGVADEFGRLLFGKGAGERETRRTIIARTIGENIYRKIALDDVAEALHLSPGRAGQVVRENFGCTLPQLVHDMKMREAARMLVATGESIADISLRLGYVDQAHFSRTFNKVHGCAPGRYRREQGGSI